CSSHKAADGRPTKRMKCEKSSLKTELEGPTCGRENLAALGERPKTPDGDRGPEDPGDSSTIQQRKGESIPETNERKQEKEQDVSLEPHAVKPGSGGSLCPQELGEEEEEEESSCGSALAEEPGPEDREPWKPPEHSGFSDEDSNQPLPVHRFFGDVELVRWESHLPAVAVPSTTRSRREVRKLHFIAKEDEEEEEEDV
ncbi:CA174 protein, partial [Calyptomena viridis]|nr:CA174 protein [Calyptomena viridis]